MTSMRIYADFKSRQRNNAKKVFWGNTVQIRHVFFFGSRSDSARESGCFAVPPAGGAGGLQGPDRPPGALGGRSGPSGTQAAVSRRPAVGTRAGRQATRLTGQAPLPKEKDLSHQIISGHRLPATDRFLFLRAPLLLAPSVYVQKAPAQHDKPIDATAS